MTRYLCKWFLAIVCLGWVVFSQTGVALAFTGPDIPDMKGDVYVQDNAHVLTQKETEDIIKVSEKLYSNAVMTIKTTDGYSIEEYANAAFRKYGIGDKKKNNGVLILVAIKDHHIRIEVGYGLEGTIPDSKAGDIIQEDAIPELKAGYPDQAILKTYQAVVNETVKEYHLNPKDFQVGEVRNPTPQSDQQDPNPVLVLCFLFGLFYVGLAVYLRFHKTSDMPQTSRDFSDIGSADVGSSDWAVVSPILVVAVHPAGAAQPTVGKFRNGPHSGPFSQLVTGEGICWTVGAKLMLRGAERVAAGGRLGGITFTNCH